MIARFMSFYKPGVTATTDPPSSPCSASTHVVPPPLHHRSATPWPRHGCSRSRRPTAHESHRVAVADAASWLCHGTRDHMHGPKAALFRRRRALCFAAVRPEPLASATRSPHAHAGHKPSLWHTLTMGLLEPGRSPLEPKATPSFGPALTVAAVATATPRRCGHATRAPQPRAHTAKSPSPAPLYPPAHARRVCAAT